MDSDTESNMSSLVSTPCATPTSINIEVENPATIQSNPESLNERWTEIQSDLGSEIEEAPLYGTVSPNILIRTEFLENPTKISSVLFQKVSVSKMDSNVEMLSNVQTVEELSQSSNENTCIKPLKLHSSFDKNPTIATKTTEEGKDLFMMDGCKEIEKK